jgi:asparagine synthase (glutamine-hydrolysing)
MSEFAGLVRFDGRPVDDATARRLERSIHSPKPPRRWESEASGLFVEAREGVAAAPEQLKSGEILLADAWLDSPAETVAALGLPRSPGDRMLCAEACARWGVEAAAERLSGDYALAHWDAAARRLTLARDALGARPIYYVVKPDFVLFATTLQALLGMPETPRDLDEVSVAHTLSGAMQDQERTIYRHIRRAPPGGTVAFQRGQVRVSRWFTRERIAPVRLGSDHAYVEAGRALLDRSVACRLPVDGLIASELSGGFDSAGATATAARLLDDRRLQVFTRVAAHPAPAGGLDERALAGLLVARHANIDWHVVDDVRVAARDTHAENEAGTMLVPRASGYNASWFESMSLKVEASGAKVLLSGTYGNSTLSWAGSPRISGQLRRGRLGGAVRDLRMLARQRGQHLPRVMAAQLYHAVAPRALERWRLHRRKGKMPWLDYALAAPDFLADLDYAEHARAVGHDIPFSLPYDSVEQRLRMIQAQRGRDFQGPARRRGTYQDQDPYFDRRMVEFCLGIPDDQYWRDGQNRWLARRVLADRVPPETLAQTGHGSQAPEWYALATARRDVLAEAVDRIARSPLASRVLDVPRMRKLLDEWPADAEAARTTMTLHRYALPRAIAMGGFLRWHEGRND